jgi:hypothetical protein
MLSHPKADERSKIFAQNRSLLDFEFMRSIKMIIKSLGSKLSHFPLCPKQGTIAQDRVLLKNDLKS